MIRSFFAIAANRVIVDSTTNQISIIDVIEGLKAQSFPILIPKITFIYHMYREDEDFTAKDVSLICTINDTEVLRVPAQVNFEQGYTTRAIISFEGFVVASPGQMKVSLMDEEVELGTLEFPVDALDIPEPHVAP